MMNEEKKKLLARLEQLCSEKSDRMQIHDVSPIIEGFMEVIEDSINDNDRSVYTELKQISSNIWKMKQDVSNLHPEHISNSHIPGATLELDEVVRSIEEATNTILDTAEAIQAVATTIPDANTQKTIIDGITKIFEACNFQDLTGQRISKVVATLEYIDSAIQKIVAHTSNASQGVKPTPSANVNNEKSLLNGPQSAGVAPSQKDVDKLFNSGT